MKSAKLAAISVIASLLVAVLPVPTWAADGTPSVPGIRASIDRAAKTLASRPPELAPRPSVPRVSAAAAQGGGGGGGGGGIMGVIGIISAVAGLVGTYYVVKSLKKQQKQAGAGQ